MWKKKTSSNKFRNEAPSFEINTCLKRAHKPTAHSSAMNNGLEDHTNHLPDISPPPNPNQNICTDASIGLWCGGKEEGARMGTSAEEKATVLKIIIQNPTHKHACERWSGQNPPLASNAQPRVHSYNYTEHHRTSEPLRTGHLKTGNILQGIPFRRNYTNPPPTRTEKRTTGVYYLQRRLLAFTCNRDTWRKVLCDIYRCWVTVHVRHTHQRTVRHPGRTRSVNKIQNYPVSSAKRVHTDNAPEQIYASAKDVCSRLGKRLRNIIPYNLEENGITERVNRTIMEGVRRMIETERLADAYWPYGDCNVALKQLDNERRYSENPIPRMEIQQVKIATTVFLLQWNGLSSVTCVQCGNNNFPLANHTDKHVTNLVYWKHFLPDYL